MSAQYFLPIIPNLIVSSNSNFHIELHVQPFINHTYTTQEALPLAERISTSSMRFLLVLQISTYKLYPPRSDISTILWYIALSSLTVIVYVFLSL